MQRSAAPSARKDSAKRPRFSTPWAATKESLTEYSTMVTTTPAHSTAPNPLTSSSRLTMALQSLRSSPATSALASSSSTVLKDLTECVHNSSSMDNKLLPGVELGVKRPAEDEPGETNQQVPLCEKSKDPLSYSGVSTKFKVARQQQSSFNSPMTSQTTHNTTAPSAVQCSDDDRPASHYYNVVWCKLSKKKHKTWEGDALLIVRGRTATLKDTEGKDIGRGTGYRTSELSGLVEGSTLVVGGKEIEVMSKISESEWQSGRCFHTVSSETTVATATSIPVSNKAKRGFHNPLTGKAPSTSSSQDLPKPRHDPSSPDALTMPRPNQKHQLMHNSKGLPLVDVVVDPRLSRHLRPHQRHGVLFLYQCVMGMKDYQGSGAILADEMGLGKSLQCIALVWTLLKQGPYGGKPVLRRVIIVTPGSLVKNWEKEFQKWLGYERLNIFAASTENRPDDFVKSPVYPVLLISYEMLMRSHDMLKSVSFDLIICDEGHRLKNAAIKTASVLTSFPTQRRIILSGTPIQNDLLEFHSILEFCNPGLLGSQSAFKKVYQEPIVRSQQPDASEEERLTGEARAQELNRLTSMFCLRRTQEINNQYLPPKIENIVFCQPFPLQLTLYRKLLSSPMLRSCLSSSSSYSSSSPHLVCIGALKKLCNSPSLLYAPAAEFNSTSTSALYSDKPTLYDGLLQCYPSNYSPDSHCLDHSGKLAVLAAMLEKLRERTLEKIVIVSNYTQTLDVLQKLCDLYQFSFLRLDGSTASTKRQTLVERFNNKSSREFIFLLSSKAGGVGLNLIGASHLVLYDIDWNPANDLQAMARIWRDGQKRTVHIYRLLTTGTIEEKIFQRQISKQSLSVVMDSSSSSSFSKAVHFTLEELKDLFTLHESTSSITHDLLNCTCCSPASPQQEPTEEEEEDKSHVSHTSRSCDLGVSVKTKEKNLSVDQLMQWKHFAHPLSDGAGLKDPLLLAASEYVTFVFQNEINHV